jgi:hypothetical protein
MRYDWVPWSASALVVGAMSLVFGTLLNPQTASSSGAQTIRIVDEASGQYLAMAVMFFFASVALTFGLPAILSVFDRKGRRLGLVGVGVFTIGTVGTCGYAMLQVFFRALVEIGALRGTELDMVAKDTGLSMFLFTWIGGFYAGVLLIAIALFVARNVPRWIPALMVAFVAVLPFASHLGRVGMAAQVLALAVAFTGIAMAAVSGDTKKLPARAAAF